jgi:hypothetical protein
VRSRAISIRKYYPSLTVQARDNNFGTLLYVQKSLVQPLESELTLLFFTYRLLAEFDTHVPVLCVFDLSV